MPKQTEADFDAQIDAWYAKYGNEPEDDNEPRADFVDFDHEKRLMIIRLVNGRRVVIPVEDIQGLSHATPEQLDQWGMHGEGFGMEWPGLGVAYRIGGLLEGLYGNQLWMEELRRRGGASKSEAKQAAARVNGAKGGRPRKEKVPA